MKNCEVCDNEYENTFQVVIKGKSHEFDCFECAIHALAPRCYRCGCKIIGHGTEERGVLFCGTHCARMSSVVLIADQPSVTRYL